MGKRFSLLHSIQIGSRAKLAGCEANHSHLVPRPRIGAIYLHSPTRHDGIALNYISRYRDGFAFIFPLLQKLGLHVRIGARGSVVG
jgi:hypothetical protein